MKKPLPISLEYRGGTTKDGAMDAYAAASSLMAFSDLLQVANESIHGAQNKIDVRVKGFRGDSFDIDFVIMGAGVLQTILSSGNSLPDLISVVKESIGLWVFLKGDPPKSVTQNENGIAVQIENMNGGTMNVSTSVSVVVANEKAGAAVEEFLAKPLNAGVDSIAITDGNKDLSVVTKDQAGYFKPVDINRDVSNSIQRISLVVESPTFKDGNKWRVFDGQSTFSAAMLDEDFISRIKNGSERFGKGDILDVSLRTIQKQSIQKLTMEKEIVKVHGHEEPLRQSAIF